MSSKSVVNTRASSRCCPDLPSETASMKFDGIYFLGSFSCLFNQAVVSSWGISYMCVPRLPKWNQNTSCEIQTRRFTVTFLNFLWSWVYWLDKAVLSSLRQRCICHVNKLNCFRFVLSQTSWGHEFHRAPVKITTKTKHPRDLALAATTLDRVAFISPGPSGGEDPGQGHDIQGMCAAMAGAGARWLLARSLRALCGCCRPVFPECVARVPVSLGGLGVRLCSPSFAFAQPFATVHNRLREGRKALHSGDCV